MIYMFCKASDETAYLLSSTANEEHPQKSIEQAKRGEVTSLSLDDIWKPQNLFPGFSSLRILEEKWQYCDFKTYTAIVAGH